jgi:hypothetical protein
MKDMLIKKIVDLEWEMFSTVNSDDNGPCCDGDSQAFRIMRVAQFQAMSMAVLESYNTDLCEAKKQGRNLMTEKYGRMMAFTAPQEYAEIKDKIPKIEETAKEYIAEILVILIDWEVAFRDEYPLLAMQGRDSTTKSDTQFRTSIETYLRGELSTYSTKTLEHFYGHLKVIKNADDNWVRQVRLNTVTQYGYSSLAHANDSLKDK